MSKNRKDRRAEKSLDSQKGTLSVTQKIFTEALHHHQAGRLQDAEQLYRQILIIDPHHAETLHLLGVLAHQVGRLDVAVELITQAIRLKKNIPAFYNNLGTTLQDQGKLNEAKESFEHALSLNADYAEARINLGNVFKELGELDSAVKHYEQALILKPDYAPTHNNLGSTLKSQGKLDAAITAYRRALALKPDYAEVFNNLGNALKERGDLNEALIHYTRAIELNSAHPETHNNMGSILKLQDKCNEAMACFNQALALNSDYAPAHFNIGSLLGDQGKISHALPYLMRAIALKPDFVEAYINLGQALQDQDRFDDAKESYERALTYKSDSTEVFSKLGNLFMAQGKLEDAIINYRRVLTLKAESPDTYNNILLAMVYAASVSPQDLARTAQEFGEKISNPLRRENSVVRNTDPDRKLRIGYVSPDFREHAVNYFFEPLLNLHDREKFDIFAYSNVHQEDAVTARLKQKFDYWRPIKVLNDDEAADLIETDGIDILVDLTGHTGGNRLLVFARKPAPIQVTWLGYPATTGMAAMDYRITDFYAEPVGLTEQLNTETLWRLPEIFCCYQAHENSPAVIDHPPFEDNGYITFGCFNNFAKVTNPVLETWAKILAQVPDSRLLLEIRGIESPHYRTELENRLNNLGLPLERVILEPRKKSNQFVLYNRLDIALDPFPCAGGTTSMDTAWMGVPLITLAGKHFVSRMGVTILTNAGLPELIAQNMDDYIRLATELALDQKRLRSLRHNLRDKVAASPLMNQTTFVRNMEEAYGEMWRKWCGDIPSPRGRGNSREHQLKGV